MPKPDERIGYEDSPKRTDSSARFFAALVIFICLIVAIFMVIHGVSSDKNEHVVWGTMMISILMMTALGYLFTRQP